MADVLYTAPTSEPVTIDEVKEHLGIDIADTDALLSSYIALAREYCEGIQNRAYITQTRELWLDDWPDEDYIRIPRPPLASVTSVRYYGTDDTEYTMTATDYFVDTKSQPGRVSLAYSQTWPTTTLRPVNGVVVKYICGSAIDSVSELAKSAIKLKVGLNYDCYDPASREAIDKTIRSLLLLNRVVPV
jgi:uncharacterized phiE125 gp8 family phage protein